MRQLKKYIIISLCFLSAALVILLSCAVAWEIIHHGYPALSWRFLSEETSQAGASGGILWQIFGTLVLIATAACVAIPFASALALLHAFYLKKSNFPRRALGLFLQMLNTVPSIVFGLIGLLVFIHYLDWGKSWLAGGLILGVMITPTIAVMLSHRIESLPPEQIEAARGLGLNRGQIITSTVIPQSASSLLSGLLLGLARAAGETAPILFVATIFSGATFPSGVKDQPILSLSYHVFVLAQDSFNESARTNLWGSALVLIALVTFLSALSIPLRHKLHNAADHA